NLLGIDEFSEGGVGGAVDVDEPAGGGGGAGGDTGGGGPVTEEWARVFGSESASDAGSSVAVTSSDEIVSAGIIGAGGDFGGGDVGSGTAQLFVARLTAAGDHAMSVASTGTAQIALGNATLDRDNNILLAGSFAGGVLTVGPGGNELTALGGSEGFVAKLAPD